MKDNFNMRLMIWMINLINQFIWNKTILKILIKIKVNKNSLKISLIMINVNKYSNKIFNLKIKMNSKFLPKIILKE